jgi:methanogenic corrinoid protein MtbC1
MLTQKKLAELVNEPKIVQFNQNSNAAVLDLIDALIHATIDYNEQEFEKTFTITRERLGIQQTMQQVIYPYLIKVGLLWNTQDIATVQEHFATHIIRRKLMSVIDSLPIPTAKKKKFLLYLPPEEFHDIPLLFADYIIRNAGWQTIYLGQSVPYAQLEKVISKTKPTHLLGFITSYKPDTDILSSLTHLRRSFPALTILLSGTPENLHSLKLPLGAHYLASPNELSIHI